MPKQSDTPALSGSSIEVMQVLDSLPDGVTIQDREFNVIYQNRAMRAAFGAKTGMKCYAAYERRDARCEGCGILRVFETGEPTLVLRTAFEAQGQTAYWENACFPIRDESGNIVAAAEVCRNVTGRVGLEDEVKRRNIELGQLNNQLQRRTAELTETFQRLEREVAERKQADLELRHAQKLRAVGQLAAGVAHEINTPAQFVTDNIQFMGESFPQLERLIAKYREAIELLARSPENRAFIQAVKALEEDSDLPYLQENIPLAITQAREGIMHISKIVRAMKEFAGPEQREKCPADLNHALDVALTVAKNEYKLVAEVETEFGQIPLVHCHLSDLNQVFLNLLVNAAHAISDVVGTGGRKGLIRLRTSREDDCVRIDVADTGSGIPEDIRDRVFEPFFTTKEVGRGTGQGLAISRSIVVDKHQGSLTFVSQVGQGTTFSIRLPIGLEPEPSLSSPSDAISALTASGCNRLAGSAGRNSLVSAFSPIIPSAPATPKNSG